MEIYNFRFDHLSSLKKKRCLEGRGGAIDFEKGTIACFKCFWWNGNVSFNWFEMN
jgi:hypothetical protein